MPNVLVETRGGWLGAKRTAFLAAIQAAAVEALRIPPHSLVLRLVEHPMECFVIPHETHETAEQYTHIVIAMFAGGALSAKRAHYQAIVASIQHHRLRDKRRAGLREYPFPAGRRYPRGA